ncbi:class I SAM-dependent methyltransferase [Aestuariispira insulae]|uniref:SAM-dependent MidA family methyltransferase n=1 Tax=Aestuariispira insulae TaxID=1461337 RepID=A0A3D9HY08_9PROT|nr:class I SAM-dependent methyltransferase [Aestuariispira insulae]RED54299.1 SAM-dependent MidA family methyltransferase [Aestuariispira insulae]
MTGLMDLIRRRITLDGPMSLADYMAECLGHPEHGYYMTRDPFGVAGDFITAPEVSQMFGELLGLWLVECWKQRDCPGNITLVELGPGRGTLMADMLRAARMAPDFLEALTIHLVETSPVLRGHQEKTLKNHTVTWHDSMDSVPQEGVLFAVANELFDALPIHQLMMTETGWRERMIGLDTERSRLVWGLSPGVPGLIAQMNPRLSGEANPGDIAEICPAGLGLARELGRRINETDGVGLFIDYGYVKSACGDSLQALKGHQYTDPLAEPGEADLTAHVDFENLGLSFRLTGARPAPVLTQGEFLGRLGLAMRAQSLARNADAARIENLQAAYDRLVGPEQMGELFKVLGVGSRDHPDLPGFD